MLLETVIVIALRAPPPARTDWQGTNALQLDQLLERTLIPALRRAEGLHSGYEAFGHLSVRRRPIARDRECLKAFLAEVEQGLHPLLTTMTAVGKRLAIDPSQLRKMLPVECASLCKTLTDRRAESAKRARRARLTELEVAIRQVGEDLATNDGPLTRRNVELRLRHLGFNVRRPDSKSIRDRVADAKCQALKRMSGSS